MQCVRVIGNIFIYITKAMHLLFFITYADISELLCNRSALALVNGEPWDMHRPLEADCELKFLHFKDENPDHCNKVIFFCII